MPMETWLLGVLGVVAVVHTIVIIAAYRRAKAAGEATRQEAGEIVCTECGTDNEPAYRFCRQCVAELPGHGGPMGPVPQAASGRHSN